MQYSVAGGKAWWCQNIADDYDDDDDETNLKQIWRCSECPKLTWLADILQVGN